MVFLVGLVDDVSGVSALDKFLVGVLAASWCAWAGPSTCSACRADEPGPGPAGPGGLVLWIVGVTNAINLLDGLDGLASGVVAIIAGSFLAYGVFQGNGPHRGRDGGGRGRLRRLPALQLERRRASTWATRAP
jgi:UDP-N-acetylmuramyl pentapeptide phosphotransferase/UDP-N-acetylglucosamine-1-phosphate transferase